MTRSVILGLALVLATTALGGCTDLKRALGIEKAPPDEFAVLVSTPLTVPPDYGLRPPHQASGRALDPTPTEAARATVFRYGQNQPLPGTGDSLTAGEQAILTKAGVASADSRIRQEVDSETLQAADANDGFVDQLLFWREPAPPPGTPVDAAKEAERVREDQALGAPVTGDDTKPSIERTQHAPIDSLL